MHATDPAPPTLLLVEDDPIVRAFLADNLTADGYGVLVADTLADGLRALEYRKPDAAIVDVGLPDGSGLDLVTRVRAAGRVATRLDPGLPLVVLSGRAGELDRIRSFDKGADDFVSKPFSYGELRRRVEALLRRAGERRASGLLRVGGLEVDPPAARCVSTASGWRSRPRSSRSCSRSPPSRSRVFTKEELLRDVWGFRAMGTTRTLDSHACRLRRKLGAAASWSTCGASATGSSTARCGSSRHDRAARDAGGGRGWSWSTGAAALALAAQAAHELRGPLSAALLAVDGLEPSARATAIELELRRAALAVDDLAAAPRGRRRRGASRSVRPRRAADGAAEAAGARSRRRRRARARRGR